MSGPWLFVRPRRIRRGAALTLVFAGVLATGAATGTLTGPAQNGRKPSAGPAAERPAAHAGRSAGTGRPGSGLSPRGVSAPLDAYEVAAAAAAAEQDGKSGPAAAREYVSRSGDRWGSVYTAREYQGLLQHLDGRYVGVGLAARRGADGRIEVDRVQPGSPAARAGLRAGDRIRTVDGTRATGRPVTEVVARLRGDGDRAAGRPDRGAGTPVVLGLERGERRWSQTLRRARLSTESVTVDRLTGQRPGTTRVRVESFTKGAGAEVRRAVRDTPRGDGILLDLRGNSGGLVTEAVDAASAFLDGGLVATYDVRGAQHALNAEPGGDTRTPVVVLVDGGTMSAAELLAGALQDRRRAVVVGSRTFGKGSVQMPSELPDGSVAELTVGHYTTPSGRSVDGTGITPDLKVGGRGAGGDGSTGADEAERRARTVLSGLGTRS
ncbi:S41 family peptidase [Streptomyces sp. LX-29]|uniref:S41 family peptidase n=1 Tax=Streptomyces sp. LX-29 TaxID=2900152 RepID=UPI00240E26DF|nr:S41 family peptidase [Streptomyces sp. LX-29]WFB09197.1 S41 family peptidase [Streptomyces sp. LX-29]